MSAYSKLQTAATRLNTDTYTMQTKNKKKRLKQFIPCPRGLVLVEASTWPNPKLLPALQQAALVIYPCHPGMGTVELLEICFEEKRKRMKIEFFRAETKAERDTVNLFLRRYNRRNEHDADCQV